MLRTGKSILVQNKSRLVGTKRLEGSGDREEGGVNINIYRVSFKGR
jgi:hypothetical protein